MPAIGKILKIITTLEKKRFKFEFNLKNVSFLPLCKYGHISIVCDTSFFYALWDTFLSYILNILLFCGQDHPGGTDEYTHDHKAVSLGKLDRNHLNLMITIKTGLWYSVLGR